MASEALTAMYDSIKVSPKMRNAAVLYAAGVVKSKVEAARAAGVGKEYFINMTNLNSEMRRLINDTQTMIQDETIATSVVLEKLGRKALGKLAELMDSPQDVVAFRAAQDLADRAPSTQKTQKLQIDSLTIAGHDAKVLAAAMLESSRESQRFDAVTRDGLVEVEIDQFQDSHTLKLIPGGSQVPADG